MKRIGLAAIACCAFLVQSNATAETLSPDELEKSILLSMMLSQDSKESRIGVRILGQRFPNDDSVCDHVAERLLKAADPAARMAVDTVAWYVVTLRENCSARYRDTLTLARGRYTHAKIVEHIDVALAKPVTAPVAQYAEGGVDLKAREAEIKQQLGALPHSSAAARDVAPGTTLGEVLKLAGVPQDLSSMTLRIARYGRATALAAHYDGAGMLMFRRGAGDAWELVDKFDEAYPVSETYKGDEFGIAQGLACLHGEMFREYVKANGRTIRRDPELMWALTQRLIRTPFPADRYEEDGMLVGVKLIAASRHADSLDMLKKIGAAQGEDVPELAREYVEDLEKRVAKQ